MDVHLLKPSALETGGEVHEVKIPCLRVYMVPTEN